MKEGVDIQSEQYHHCHYQRQQGEFGITPIDQIKDYVD